jgi:hypothetical protein
MDIQVRACIINVAKGGWYPKGQKRLLDSLVYHGNVRDVRHWTDFPNDLYDKNNGYNVKPSAFEQVMNEGYTHILWLDSSVWAVQNPELMFDHINEHGYYLWKNGYNCAQECSDVCLDYFKVSRDDAEKMPCVSTSMFGVNLFNPKGKEFIERWLQSARDGIFNGSRLHDNQSADPRFLWHRQDQSPASIIANQMGLHLHEGNELSGVYNPREKHPQSVIFLMRGL